MVYRDGTDDEPLEFCVWAPGGRIISSNPMDNVRYRRKETVEKPKEDDLSKYYDYECNNSDVDVKEEEEDTYWNWDKKIDGFGVVIVIAIILFVLEVILTWK